MATGVEQPTHPPGELWFRLLDRPPRRHGRAAYSEAGKLLDLSHQRIAQLVKRARRGTRV
jgi:hypothetical protein